ncbi:hypothetical protein Deipr_0575 [Deinococcus proteolyticus MRP]|uniref:DUF2905 domain-containing protein n=1 Tax=Deinococcus proteolyticus (strain ATCC 35074 / DSM 20540 / JCM 6276 / NBRC 101906 / NCIMB 13154 / VKM Ac-1939 / CCM 2703 / MRP) TaxID=693977 RepID=F0RKW4_DEIPM|nr:MULTISPECIES: DUF2905 family protein [Deinococcus]ADY25737.1 hypothetical protein Deipr_0575 [Deinococcus proteolyticus MRP]MCY1701861.1 DUF2905 family protein [Deinococcus sp. SL84]
MTDGPRLVMFLGALLLVLGLLWAFAPGTLKALFGWFGHLPGDINHRSGNTFVFIPWVSMLALSLGLSLLSALLRMFR